MLAYGWISMTKCSMLFSKSQIFESNYIGHHGQTVEGWVPGLWQGEWG